MARSIRAALAVGLGATLMGATMVVATPAAADPPDEVTAYVWANNSTAASYAPSSTYAYNSAGGAITVRRTGTGVYTVVFAGAATAGGVAHVHAYGSSPQVVCTLAGWGPTLIPTTLDLQVFVRCFTAPSTPVDSRFVASFTNAQLSGTGRFSYLWTDQANPIGVRTLTHAYQYDSQGGPLSYQRLNIGEYRVNLPPSPPALAPIFPMLHVTPYSASEWVSCQIGWPDSRIVTCSRADGDPVDTRFTLTYGLRVDLTGHTTDFFGSGTLYEDFIAGTSIGGDHYVSTFPDGGGWSGTVHATGSYTVRMRGIGAAGGHAALTVVGEMDSSASPRGRCSIVGWSRSGPDELVQVSCTGFGPAFAGRNLNVRISFTNYRVPV